MGHKFSVGQDVYYKSPVKHSAAPSVLRKLKLLSGSEFGSVSTENLSVNRALSIILSFLLMGTNTLAKAESLSREELVSQGQKFAVLVCAACHVVATDQRSPPILRTPGPTFDAIANKPETSETSLRTFLLTTHGK
jgi:hypothetical protein